MFLNLVLSDKIAKSFIPKSTPIGSVLGIEFNYIFRRYLYTFIYKIYSIYVGLHLDFHLNICYSKCSKIYTYIIGEQFYETK